MSNSFKTLGLSPETLGAVRRARFTAPTPIQAQAIPPALAGRDVIGCAATGTGKTAAYLLPLIERLAGEPGPTGLVLAPTRELVQQIAQEASFFGEPRGVTQAVVIGGTDMSAQVEALRQKPTLVLATPGRLADLLQAGAVNLSAVRTLVLDEADRMLEMGFLPELQRILAALPRERQTLLFSATLGHNVTLFAQELLRRPVRVEVTPSGTPAARAVQRMYEVEADEKYPLLLTLLERDQLSALVFTRTRERAEKVLEVLKRAGHKSALIHSDRTQGQRRQALEGFRRGQYRCLVATDIASRGLDVEDVGHVINFDLPHSPEDYVHRIGRTARAGASGRASTFVTERDEETVRAIERIIRMPVPRAEVPRKDPVFLEERETFQAEQGDVDDLMKLEDRPRPRAPERAREARGAGPRREGPERRGGDSRRTAPGRSPAPRPGREEEGARRAKPARRVEGAFGRDMARKAKEGRGRTEGKGKGKGKSGPRGAGRPGGKAGGRPGGARRGPGPSPRGRGGGGRSSR
ncbi:RNA helicase [Archangium sp. Cb G35]|uniref:DEAD/DEAH box helicase n=1 Tax=Archangium sp. Cb G35 TaxID=1920190 RepID=UPI0009378077|nr:DEAD/DEAH box helicase [Archangium sp. Cb G35]OJT23942.1 RNA helicase [Archangium sp. Cb G35]